MSRARNLSNAGSNITTTGIYQKQLSADGQGLIVKGSYTGNPNIFEVAQVSSDGYAYVRDAVGNTTQFTGYPAGLNIIRGRITMPEQPSFSVSNGGNTTGPGVVQFGAGGSVTKHNRGGHFNTSTYTFTAPVAGNYSFSCYGNVNGATSGSALYWYFRKNGSQIGSYAYCTSNGNWNLMCASEVIALAVGDYVDVYMNTSGGHFDYGANWSLFSGYLVG